MNSSSAAARWRAIALLSAIFGAGVSLYLLVEYTTGQPGICLTGSGCDEVRASQFAYPLGIPLPLFGAAFYLVAAWLAYATLSNGTVAGQPPHRLLLVVALAGVAFSALLTILEAFVIRSFCTWCLASAGASLVLLVATAGLAAAPVAVEAPGKSSRIRHQRDRAREEERTFIRRTAAWAAGGTALLFGALLVFGALPADGGSGSSDLVLPSNPSLGSGRVTVVEFADFQCPACAVVGPTLQSLAQTDDLTLVFRYFPLEAIHANANSSARAAEAAKQQGEFWGMAELLYAQQAAWENLSVPDATEYFAGLAAQLDMDVNQWRAAYDSSAVRNAVALDAAAARDLNLPGTPTIFIGGEQYDGDRSAAGIRAAVAQAEARMTAAPSSP
jgi:protein-disulfide isomerase